MEAKDIKIGQVAAEEPSIMKVDSAGSTNIIGEDGDIMYTIDPKAERRLVWKFDLRILPVLAIMYLCNALDSELLQSHVEQCKPLTEHRIKSRKREDCRTGERSRDDWKPV